MTVRPDDVEPEDQRAAPAADWRSDPQFTWPERVPWSQLGPDFIILRETLDHPPSEAEITMSIDGREDRWIAHATTRQCPLEPCKGLEIGQQD